ncbi:MAG: hypothetical protein GY808_14825 [Gammaproteobacteria bacterium]|nr:hypothetical protein [Gammaproteobacteria bacterium]
MNTLLISEQGKYFLIPILYDEDNQQQLHVKQHEDNSTLCDLPCDSKTEILKKFPPEYLRLNWSLCPDCWEKTKIMKLSPASELNDPIFDNYQTLTFGLFFLTKNRLRQFKQNYLNQTLLYEITDTARIRSSEFIPKRMIAFILPPVRKHDWDIRPMPDSRKPLAIEGVYSKREYRRIKAGYYPKTMEEKWFIYYESNWLYFHYAWSGICVFQLQLQKSGNKIHIAESWVNSDPNQVGDGELFDTELLMFLLNEIVLGNEINHDNGLEL